MRRGAGCTTVRLAAAIAAIIASHPGLVAAHPMGNFSINHYAAIAVWPGRVEIRYLIDMAEIPTFQEMRESGFAADPADPRVAAYLRQKARAFCDGIILELNGRRLELREVARDVIFPPGAGGLPTMKIGMRLMAPAALDSADAAALDYRDSNFPGRAGWKEVIALGRGGVALADSSVPERDRSAELSNYPVDLLSSPPQVLAARIRPRISLAGAGRNTAQDSSEASLALRANRIGTPRNAFTELMTVRKPGLWFLLTAALIAAALGALHALEPGHGKTVVAAYLVGSRGTARHALMLAATVTASHTAGVYVLGALTLYASQWIIPERLYPWLGGVSGLIVAALGAGLFMRRLFARGPTAFHHAHVHPDLHDHQHAHPHGHEHDHYHPHPHRHDIFGRHIEADHASPPDGERLSLRGLLALGVTGGIVPCPAALVVLLSALSLNRAGFGLFLIVAFSAGLAAVLIGFGLAVVYARQLVARRLRIENNPALTWLPLVSSAVITIAGVAITFQALASGGVIRLGR
jgi:ABC-type nickel/cobalt efflux system permease component RcnA